MVLFVPLFLQFIATHVRPTLLGVVNFASWAPKVALARLAAKWRSLLTIIIGVILGAGIGALIPLYSNAVGQVGMVQRLEQERSADAHAQIRISLEVENNPNIDLQVSEVNKGINSAVDTHFNSKSHLDEWVDEVNPYVRTSKMGMLDSDGEFVESTRASVLYLANWEDHVRVVGGTLPSQNETVDGVDFNVAVSLDVANELDWQVGDILTIDQRLDNRGNQVSGAHISSQPFTVQIKTIVAPIEDNDPFWMDLDNTDPPLGITEGGLWQREINLLTTQENAQAVYRDYVPATDTIFGWRILFDHNKLSYVYIDTARQALRDFDEELDAAYNRELDQEIGKKYHTNLISYRLTSSNKDEGILQDYARKQSINFVPFTLLLVQMCGLVVFFLIVTAALVRRGERREISMLQSRGASNGSILALRSIEALLISIFGALIAPFLAQLLLKALGPVIADTNNFPLPLTAEVFAFSFAASFVTFIALTLSIIPTLLLPLISAGGAALRSARWNWFQKYYIDVVLVVFFLPVLMWFLFRSTPLIETAGGERRPDYLVLCSPFLLLLGLAILALRLFPITAYVVSVFAERRKSLISVLSTWQLSREPLHYGRITFLLALAISIGWFATSFRATVQRNQEDQARYLVGTDVRLYERDTNLGVERSRNEDFYLADESVEAVSLAHRVTKASYSDTQGFAAVDILAIDPRTFGQTTVDYWRNDLGNIVVPYGPSAEVNIPTVGETLPFTPAKFGLWVRLDRLTNPFAANTNYQPDLFRLGNRVTINMRFQDEAGTWILVPFTPIRSEYIRQGQDSPGFGSAAHTTSGWIYYEADFSTLNYEPQGELRLVSLYWEHRTNNTNGERRIKMLFADFSLIDAVGNATPYNLANAGQWSFVADAGAQTQSAPQDIRPVNTVTDNPGLHPDAFIIVFDQFALWSRLGVNLNYAQPQPLEAVLSASVAERTGLTDLQTDPAEDAEVSFSFDNVYRTRLQLTSRRSTEYFPSLFDENNFVVVDIREFLYAVNQRPSATYYPQEVWLKLGEDVDTEDEVNAVLAGLQGGDSSNVTYINEVTYADEFDQLETDPLSLGLLGLMFLAFLIAMALSIVGLITYAALTTQARRGEFGILRALGLPSGRVVWSLLFEQFFVVGVAATLGAALGVLLSLAVVPRLALGTTGEGVTPPFITQTEWAAIGNFGLILAVVLLSVFAFSFVLIRQLSLSRTLRLGDE